MTPDAVRQAARNTTLGLTGALVGLVVFLNVTGPAFNVIILGAQLVPLALPVPGLIRGSSRACQWLCLVVLFFLTQGILRAFDPGMRIAGLLETAICVGLFVSAIIFIRAARRSGQSRHPAR